MANLNLSKFKKIKEEKDHTVLKHDDGHTIKLAHGGLSSQTKLQLKKLPMHFDEGGDVPSSDQAQSQPQQSPVVINVNGNGAQPQAQPAPAAAPAEPAPPQPEAPQPQMNREPAQAPAPQAPQGIAPQSPVVAQDPTGMDQYYKTAVGGIGQQQQGIQQEAQALGKQSQAEAQVAEQGIQQQQKSLEDYQNHFNDLQQKRTALAQDYANGHIDTSRYVNNMSTGQKVLTAIGLILGGYSGDGTDFIDKQINRDIEAQKVDMDKKHNLLSANMQEFGNLHDATDMARVYQADMYSKQLFAAAQKTNDPIIKARALQQAGALQTNIAAPLMQQVAQRRWLMGIGQGQAQTGEDMQDRSAEQTLNALRVVAPERAKEMEERYVPGVGFASIKVPDKSREEMVTRTNLQRAISDLENWTVKNQGSLDPATVNEGKTKAALVQDLYRRGNGQGVFREGEAKFVKSIVNPDPSAFFASYRTLPGYKALAKQNASELQGLYRSYGLKQRKITPVK